MLFIPLQLRESCIRHIKANFSYVSTAHLNQRHLYSEDGINSHYFQWQYLVLVDPSPPDLRSHSQFCEIWSSSSSGNEKFCFLGRDVVHSGMNSQTSLLTFQKVVFLSIQIVSCIISDFYRTILILVKLF